MKKFKVILQHEFKQQISNKIYLFLTILLSVAILGGLLFLKNEVEKAETNKPLTLNVYGISDEEILVFDELPFKLKVFKHEKDFLADYNPGIFFNASDHIKIHNIHSLNKINQFQLLMGLEKSYRNIQLIETFDVSVEALKALDTKPLKIDFDQILEGESIESLNFQKVLNFSFIMVLFLAVTLYGGVIATSITQEKNSKAMELLVTSASSNALVAGKVLGVGASFLLQFFFLILVALTGGFLIFGDFFNNFNMISYLFEFLEILPWFSFYLIIGFFSYMFLIAAFSSFARASEDANLAATPVILLLVIIYSISLSFLEADVNLVFDSLIMRIVSHLPLVSPFFFMMRLSAQNLSFLTLLLGLLTNVLSLAGLIHLSAKLYRAGTLYYGNRFRFKDIFKSFRGN